GERLVAVFVEGDVIERDDVGRPLARLRELEVADLCFDVPGIVGPAFDPRIAEADRPRAREPAVLDGMARAEHEVVDPVRAGLDRVLEMVRELHDRVTRADLTDRLVLPQEAVA